MTEFHENMRTLDDIKKKCTYVLLLSFQCSYLVLLYSYFLPMYIHCMYTG